MESFIFYTVSVDFLFSHAIQQSNLYTIPLPRSAPSCIALEVWTNEKIHPPASLRKGGFFKRESRHLPIFAGRLQPTIFGTTELNFCVRNGNRWNLCVIGTGQICFKPGLHIFSFKLRDAPSKLNITANSQMEYLKIVVKPSTY